MRLVTRRTKLYTEMIVDSTINHTKQLDRFLAFDPVQHPIACQLGGSNPASLASAARIVESYGYDEINLNCGCPSSRVAVRVLCVWCPLDVAPAASSAAAVSSPPRNCTPSSSPFAAVAPSVTAVRVACVDCLQGAGCFGARLMFSPALVRDCCAAMRAVVSIPVTVKCRLGADNMDSYEEFKHFVEVVAESGVQHFIVHARKCLLNGLSPHGNRTVPPLHYDWVYRIAAELPHLSFSLNGGVTSLDTARRMMLMTPESYSEECARAAVAAPKGGVDGGGDGSAACREELASGDAVASVAVTADVGAGAGAAAAAAAGGGSGGTRAGSAGRADASVVDEKAAHTTAPPTVTDGEAECCGAAVTRPAGAGAGHDARRAEEHSDGSDAEVKGVRKLPKVVTVDWDPAVMGTGLLNSVMIGRFACSNPWDFWSAAAVRCLPRCRV